MVLYSLLITYYSLLVTGNRRLNRILFAGGNKNENYNDWNNHSMRQLNRY
jgi:hypothetical protein